MTRHFARRLCHCCAAAAVFSGCGLSESYPDAYGIYAWKGGSWSRLDKEKSKIDLELPGDVRFLIHDKGIERASKGFRVLPKVFVRNHVSQNPDGANRVVTSYRMWDLKGDAEVDGRVSPIKGQPEMVAWTPAAALGPGVFLPVLDGTHLEPFIVSRGAVLANLEQSALCFDKISTMAWGIPMGVPDRYRPCAEDQGNVQGGGLPMEWIGTWKSGNGQKILELRQRRVVIKYRDGGRDIELAWTPGATIGEGQIGSEGKSVSQAEISAQYEDALRAFKEDSTDFRVSPPENARADISAISSGRYDVLTGYAGGDCNIWDWIRDGDKLLEVTRCKYGFSVDLLTRSRDL